MWTVWVFQLKLTNKNGYISVCCYFPYEIDSDKQSYLNKKHKQMEKVVLLSCFPVSLTKFDDL